MGQVGKTWVFDAGNSSLKVALFQGMEMERSTLVSSVDALRDFAGDDVGMHALLCRVGNLDAGWLAWMQENFQLHVLSQTTPLPLLSLYQTPETLGMDRISGVAGAQHFFPDTSCLVIDAGTCITYDFIDKTGNYHGGAISPGLAMRFKAMNHFTAKLPMAELDEAVPELSGKSTRASLQSGVFYGILGEINEQIARYSEQGENLQVLLCGGDGPVFGKHIKNNIFAAPNLVLYGLNKILLFNVQKGL